MKLATATPHNTGGSKLPTNIAISNDLIQVLLSPNLPLNSNDTPRKINATSIKTNAI